MCMLALLNQGDLIYIWGLCLHLLKKKKTRSHQVFQGPCLSSILRAEHTHNLDRDSEAAILQSMGELETCFPFAMEQSVSSGLPLTRTQV